MVLELPQQTETLIEDCWKRRTRNESNTAQLIRDGSPIGFVGLITSQKVKHFAPLFDGSSDSECDQQMAWFKL